MCCGNGPSAPLARTVNPDAQTVTVYLAKDAELNRYAYCTTTLRWKARKSLNYKSAGQLTVHFTRNDLGEWHITSTVPEDVDLTGLPCLDI